MPTQVGNQNSISLLRQATLAHSSNFVTRSVFVSRHKIFLVGLFCAPPAAPWGNCPLLLPPVSYAQWCRPLVANIYLAERMASAEREPITV